MENGIYRIEEVLIHEDGRELSLINTETEESVTTNLEDDKFVEIDLEDNKFLIFFQSHTVTIVYVTEDYRSAEKQYNNIQRDFF